MSFFDDSVYKSVSYTHLDVYKRQPFNSSLSKVEAKVQAVSEEFKDSPTKKYPRQKG